MMARLMMVAPLMMAPLPVPMAQLLKSSSESVMMALMTLLMRSLMRSLPPALAPLRIPVPS